MNILKLVFLALSVLYIPQQVIFAQDIETETDSSIFQSENYIAKKGFNIAPLPEFMYGPFIGLYVGVNSSIFDYGDGKKYPNYYQSLNVIAAYGTKGKTNFSLKYYNYGQQIVYAYLGYTHYTLLPFYGYNGYQTLYNDAYKNPEADNYITKPFYNYDHSEFRASVSIQDTLDNTFFNWKVGIDIRKIKTGRVDFEKLNKGVATDDTVPDLPTLYDQYIEWGEISQEEKKGGWANSLIAGMVYDTRDRITNPMTGIYSELTFRYTPSFIGNYNDAFQLSMVHRQYFTMVKEKLSFAYRLRYDAAFGEIPFYSRIYLADEAAGIGGGGTLWGIHQNRIVSKQFASANFEFRAKLFRFKFLNQNWYLAAVPLFHAGYMVEELDNEFSSINDEDRQIYLKSDYGKWYNSYGFGGKIVMNENTVIGIDWAKALNKEAGSSSLYIGMGYTF